MSPFSNTQHWTSSSSTLSTSSASSNDSMESLNDRRTKSLTPQRKHHKLLKDGSEVWSQEVELIFVDGLHKYWESPWATYSRGRSRWRNQFLVDHLRKNGIERSKKQVASHIQVLRNMWRGEPEFALVAGGEELFQEGGLLASPNSTTSKSSPEPSTSGNLDASDWRSSWSSSASSTPDFPSFDFPVDLGASAPPHGLDASLLAANSPIFDSYSPRIASTNVASPPVQAGPTASRPRSSSVKLEPLSTDPVLFGLPQRPVSDGAEFSVSQQPVQPPNRLRGINLWTDGISLSSTDVDRLMTASGVAPAANESPISFRAMLRLTVKFPAGGSQGAPHFQGIKGAVSFASRWSTVARCYTKTWAGTACVSREWGTFVLPPHEVSSASGSSGATSPMVIANLPDSSLSRCGWLDPISAITQQIIVDREVLAVMMYNLDRSSVTSITPAVELVGFQKYPWRMAHASSPTLSPPISPSHYPTYSQSIALQATDMMHAAGSGDGVSLSSGMAFGSTQPARASNTASRNPPRHF
ncbi:uncharacterized protein LAESUDRAFT_267335 [Laetiporus sulphureus 93-53]|uniref:TEA domain-containing protein n=1 Tax=Laetiporus sulphureus 93-53 TaxID=1314785 RepID=A0A165H878_9APHY|nr:uncharacterized protein LAESUDRAFT_267335 [Laetiporus sulphureus 93-53]KZT11381.1 hypothetical protein LAESUDRAFT_267335 [Laetiporus sulphureus 93-53]